MLVASTERRFGDGAFRATFLIDRQVFVNVVSRSALTHDSRFVPRLSKPSAGVLLYLIHAGCLDVLESRAQHRGPVALLLDEEQFEGSPTRSAMPFRSYGTPFEAVEIRFSREHLRFDPGPRPATFSVPAEIWDQVARVLARADGDAGAQTVRDLFEQLAVAGFVAPDLAKAITTEDDHLSRVWRAVRPMASAFDLLGSLESLALGAGLSLRQVAREIEGFSSSMRAPFFGWRESLRRYRIKAAILGLSAESLPIAEVARIAGYGSAEAMARAFRDASLPSPSRVREEILLATRERGSG
ncbi:MAG: helix-turn-helix transcriptional regulator [Myxococcales bacterium]|nr:helix-turn-helix transcriptional regulator [Myxococcales bacterium]